MNETIIPNPRRFTKDIEHIRDNFNKELPPYFIATIKEIKNNNTIIHDIRLFQRSHLGKLKHILTRPDVEKEQLEIFIRKYWRRLVEDYPKQHTALSVKEENTKVKELDIGWSTIELDRALTLSESKVLVKLTCDSCNLGNRGAVALSKSQTLASLNVYNNMIGTAGITALAKNTSLRTLNIGNNILDLEGVYTLSANTSLTSLGLYKTNIGNIGAKILFQNKTLQYLNLGACGIDYCYDLFCDISLKSLILSYNRITNCGAIDLAKNTTLTHLNLSSCIISDQGAIELGKNTTLTSLNLDHNWIQSKGAIALSNHVSLLSLSLEHSYVDNAGGVALAKNNRLKSLSLDSYLLDDITILALSRHSFVENLTLHVKSGVSYLPLFRNSNFISIYIPSYPCFKRILTNTTLIETNSYDRDKLIILRNKIFKVMTLDQEVYRYIPVMNLCEIIVDYI